MTVGACKFPISIDETVLNSVNKVYRKITALIKCISRHERFVIVVLRSCICAAFPGLNTSSEINAE